jgi:low temperature requirement protein LtrA
MAARDRNQAHRASTPLELLFDLCFVVAVSQAAGQLHRGLAAGHPGPALIGYAMVFMAIWWAWMNFTWFASAYDTDDVPYRVLSLVQIAGVLVLAAGVPAAFDRDDFTVVVIGYVIMRAAMISQWLRAAREHREGRSTALRYAAGIAVVQVGWIARLALPTSWGVVSFAALALAEMAVPVWAERSGRPTSWHPEHIVERYSLFTLIVLGECVLAATVAVQSALSAGGLSGSLLMLSLGGLLLIFGIWWSYFKRSVVAPLRASPGSVFTWGYGHFAIFASVAALGAGLQVAAEATQHAAGPGSVGAALAVAVPVAIYLTLVGLLQAWMLGLRLVAARFAAAAALILLAAALAAVLPLSVAVLAMGIVLTALISADVIEAEVRLRRQPPPRSE